MTGKTGTLFIVATPIGNLADLSRRATDVLSSVAVIAVEDSRHSGRLLDHLGISKPLIAFHEHNERERFPACHHALTPDEVRHHHYPTSRS